jgi:hypothetical protein
LTCDYRWRTTLEAITSSKERVMPPTRALQVLLNARRQAFLALDDMVRAELMSAAATWRLTGHVTVSLTMYEQVYDRIPRLGGHWTLFQAGATPNGHEVITASVALEFKDTRPADFWVSGAEEVIAGACTATALREALAQCGGPLRQVTQFGPDRAETTPLLSTMLVPYTAGPVGSLN